MSDFKISKIQKTMLVGMVFLFVQTLHAAKVETYKDVIEKAYNLAAQKDRTQALMILANSVKKEKKSLNSQTELLDAIDKIASIFLSEKSQQVYETGMSLLMSDPVLAQAKFLEAYKLEAENIFIMSAYVRSLLTNNDCNQAAAELVKTQTTLGFLELHNYFSARVALCQSKYQEYVTLIQRVDYKKTALNAFWPLMAAEYEYKYNNLDKAKQKLETVKDQENPEIFYWLAFIAKEKNERDEASIQKYLSMCKSLSARQVRKFFYEPLLCRRTTEVESWLKTNDN